ncbi:uncharacterized protein RMCC_6542 [Mycolicibacterium canariasense]|uniref:Protein-glutamine gamma-glutamyltransferase-like C-terminal domain-containing protein n=1 Tax=Mycolicibacterium canariasense TaxID=228230 RepID=A0A100WJ98_MYCCR|nr:DUF4129 domain-containing protein [Mycolicibacterium canariasense]MCV7207169.1 DUF4129 domain-containing protein [Mycolicibacterium canariasense]ORV06590.1 hypothetical protein AWB94_16765 [Mycolicibacterium canariasense]GAS99577.1 uncharacterized protein RMCC_6542 [Mycolicibacterium canariasense]
MSGLEIDSDAAHEAAQRELGKPIYPKPSLTDQLWAWLEHLLYQVFNAGSSVPGGWITIGLLSLLVVIAAVVAIRVAMRTMHTRRGGDAALFDNHQLGSAEHRALAQQCAAQGDWAAAIRHRLRAVARRLEETAVLDPAPGRTATELARDAAAALPALHDELTRAAEIFNDVAYGDRPATEAGYRVIADLDDHFDHAPAAPPDAPSAAPDTWVPVR